MGDFKTGAESDKSNSGGVKKNTAKDLVWVKIEPTFHLTKKFRFETAHRLAKGYVGKCAHLHGHSWNGEITIKCVELDDQGMAIDYKDIGTFCKHIEEELDHKTILHKGDEKLIASLAGIGSDVVIFEENPTSEAIAKWIFKKAEIYFKGVIQKGVVHSVSIEETCTSRCVYTQ